MALLAEKEELNKEKARLEEALKTKDGELKTLTSDLSNAKNKAMLFGNIEAQVKDKDMTIKNLKKELLDKKQAFVNKDSELANMKIKLQQATANSAENKKVTMLEEEKRLLERCLRDSQLEVENLQTRFDNQEKVYNSTALVALETGDAESKHARELEVLRQTALELGEKYAQSFTIVEP
eukprot:1861334-Pyramimonas_sp.AAC.2